MKRFLPGKVSPAITALLLVLIIIALVAWLLLGKGCKGTEIGENTPSDTSENSGDASSEVIGEGAPTGSGSVPNKETLPPEKTEKGNEAFRDLASLMASLKDAADNNDEKKLDALLAASALSPESIQAFKNYLAENPNAEYQLREVGEVEINKLSRWAMGVKGQEKEIMLQVRKLPTQEWQLDSVDFTQLENTDLSQAEGDSLSVADAFVKAVLAQDFQKAKSYVKPGSISDAKIASLCIMFEEGKYALQSRKPIRALFTRETKASYMANVQTSGGEEKGQFSVNLSKKEAGNPWKVDEINYDRLLSDYIQRVAGGDAYYTPIVKNPEGGDTLALYFDSAVEDLTPRAERQLSIIAKVLMADSSKKITLSGHADAIGTDDSNYDLSLRRAKNVRTFLSSQGIPDKQIRILAYGETKPRRQNDTDEGRRANRRAEIYLDF